MKNLVLAIVVLFSASAFAAPAMQFKCGGVEKISEGKLQAVDFVVNYSDWENTVGYNTQNLEVTVQGSKQPSKLVELQDLRDVASNHDCSNFTEVERLVFPSGYEAYKVEFNFTCGDDKNLHYSLLGYCEKSL